MNNSSSRRAMEDLKDLKTLIISKRIYTDPVRITEKIYRKDNVGEEKIRAGVKNIRVPNVTRLY